MCVSVVFIRLAGKEKLAASGQSPSEEYLSTWIEGLEIRYYFKVQSNECNFIMV